jgi:tRNA dimethylallyltransferase
MQNGAHNKPVVLIAGPTASGKSAVALKLAEAGKGTIINADALQVYRELKILSARPTPEEERRAPHRLYGMVPASEPYSVGLWLEAASQVIGETWRQGRIPIVTGGTGLYFKALEEGLVRLSPIPPPVRKHWRDRLKREGAGALHAELARLSRAEAERLRASDGQRIVRALEVIETTGHPLPAWQKQAQDKGFLAEATALRLYLSPPRRELYDRIDRRFDEMMHAGALAEVEALLRLHPDPTLPVMKATGIRELALALQGRITLEEACRIAKRNSRHYAKRQITWAKRHMISWKWLSEQLMERSVEGFFNFIRLDR